ncbi:unnamed protein product [Caenorhabditis angaria]|uniref:Uncharacterized protein n=1 Tax=Caenorhabditis angaria TaxID=860376 RepID=A0A9P1N0N6_9PELO|nr:unnamed protein product [Caenorhabditis angaria]
MIQIDQRQDAQICLSAFQFLIDDFGNDVNELKEIMDGDDVDDLKYFIESSWGDKPEHYTPLKYIEKYPNHEWWKHEIDERKKKEEKENIEQKNQPEKVELVDKPEHYTPLEDIAICENHRKHAIENQIKNEKKTKYVQKVEEDSPSSESSDEEISPSLKQRRIDETQAVLCTIHFQLDLFYSK